jgi:hypothetical protein
LLEGIKVADMPVLRGYVATTPKPASQVLLVTQQTDPLLAEWQYGLGRVVAWTSDAKNRWAQDWVNWGDFSNFWTAAVKRTIPSPVDRFNQVTVTPDSDGVRITVDSVADDRSYVNFLRTRATLVAPSQQTSSLDLPQVAPGRYEAEVRASTEGPYFLNIAQQAPDGQAQVSRPAGFVVPYSSEYRTLKTNPELLGQLASATGGRQLVDPLQAFDRATRTSGSPREIWPALVALAAVLLLLDIALRRLRLTPANLQWAIAHAVTRLLGRAHSIAAPAQAGLVAAKDRIAVAAPSGPIRPGPRSSGDGSGRDGAQSPPVSQPASSTALGSRLLEAKKRARQPRD